MKKFRAVAIFIVCALALGGCHSRKQAVRPGVERPKLPAVTGSTADSNDAAVVARLIDGAYGWIGTPYRYGGTERSGADCSGFLQRLFADVAAVSLPRNSRKQAGRAARWRVSVCSRATSCFSTVAAWAAT